METQAQLLEKFAAWRSGHDPKTIPTCLSRFKCLVD